MDLIKTFFFTIFLIGFVNLMSTKEIAFPIAGLFVNETQDEMRDEFIRLKNRGTKVYYGEALNTSSTDSYTVALEVCEFSKSEGLAALIDARPTNGICDNVCLLCNKYKVSHLTLGWEPINDIEKYPFTFSYYPPPDLVSKAYSTLIRDILKWDKFTILYEDEGSFVRLKEIISSWPYENEPILYRQLEPGGDNREIFKHIFKVAKMTYHIVDCAVENIPQYMKQVIEIENSTKYQSFIFTSLDARLLDFDQIPETLNANFSTLSILQQERNIDTALATDALTHLEKAIRKMSENPIDITRPEPTVCRQQSSSEYEEWEVGDQLRDALRSTISKGLTDNIEFDDDGNRHNFKLYYFHRNAVGSFKYSGYWDSNKDKILLDETTKEPVTALKSGVIKVGSREGLPYFTYRENENGTKVPVGYIVDLVTKVFQTINKLYDLELKPEFVGYNALGGKIEGTKRWSGIIGALMDHEIEMAVRDISITSERLEVVDFSTPFMTTGISMLFKERDPEPPNMFSFTEPLSLDVWLYLGTTYIVVSFILFICARMSQDDWVNPHPCNQNPENLENIWSLYNCTWFTMGAIMTQGCDILPRGLGSRWIAGLWWFFSLIVTASYTANMSTFLSNSRRSSDIRDVKMLSEQNKVTYGAVEKSATAQFFQNSNETVYQKIWSVMNSAKPPVFTHDNDEGRDRVVRSKGNYVFFMEATAIKYYTERECSLKMVGHQLDSKEYGIAMPKNFPYKGLVDVAILDLQESGELNVLENKWWVEDDNKEHCKEVKEKQKKEGGDDGSLQMANTSGIFIVLGSGALLGLVVAIIDFMLHAHQVCVKEKITFREALSNEWNASLDPRSLHKATAPRSSATSSSPSPLRKRSKSRAASVLTAASSFINFDEIY